MRYLLGLGSHTQKPRRLLLPFLAALVLTGCAQNGAEKYNSYSSLLPKKPVPAAVQTNIKIEADGLPAQHPPRTHQHATIDDPSEPFSPNYGDPLPALKTAVRPTQAGQPLPRQLNFREAKVIIARAVAEHELRLQAQETASTSRF